MVMKRRQFMLAAAAGVAAPAWAQESGPVDPGGERVNQLIVYGNDPCPRSEGATITVCARKDEEERFRIPKPLRDNPSAPGNQVRQRMVSIWAMRAITRNTAKPTRNTTGDSAPPTGC